MAEAVTLSRYLMGGPDLQWTPLRPSHRGSLHYSFLLLFTTNSAPLLHSTLVCFSASQAKFFFRKVKSSQLINARQEQFMLFYEVPEYVIVYAVLYCPYTSIT